MHQIPSPTLPNQSMNSDLVRVPTEPTRIWIAGKSPHGNAAVIEIPPRKRNIWFPHEPEPAFIQFPYTICCLKYNPIYYQCNAMLVLYSPTKLTGTNQYLHFIHGVSGSICGGSSNLYRRHNTNFEKMISTTLEAFWGSAFYDIVKSDLAAWKDVKHPDDIWKITNLTYVLMTLRQMCYWSHGYNWQEINSPAYEHSVIDLEKDLIQ